MSSVYWIHHPEHTDMFSQGYIGVSKDLKKRWNDHAKRTGNLHLKRAIKKYGWDNLVKEVVLVAEEAYCLMIERFAKINEKPSQWLLERRAKQEFAPAYTDQGKSGSTLNVLALGNDALGKLMLS